MAFKFNLRDLCIIKKDDGESRLIKIEGREETIRMECPLYDVRETLTRKSYSACETSLVAFNDKDNEHRELHPWTRGKPLDESPA